MELSPVTGSIVGVLDALQRLITERLPDTLAELTEHYGIHVVPPVLVYLGTEPPELLTPSIGVYIATSSYIEQATPCHEVMHDVVLTLHYVDGGIPNAAAYYRSVIAYLEAIAYTVKQYALQDLAELGVFHAGLTNVSAADSPYSSGKAAEALDRWTGVTVAIRQRVGYETEEG